MNSRLRHASGRGRLLAALGWVLAVAPLPAAPDAAPLAEAPAHAATSPLISSPGTYRSPGGASVLTVVREAAHITAKFSHRGPDGRSVAQDLRCEAEAPWAAYFEDDLTLWFYRDGNSVLVTTLELHEGSTVSFTASKQIVDPATEADLIPKPLREFIAQKTGRPPTEPPASK